MPKFWIENLIKRPRNIGIVRAEPEKMIALVVDNVCIPTELDQGSGWQRGIVFFARMGRESGELTIRSKETRRSQFPVNWIVEIVDEADAIIVFSRWWNQRRSRKNELGGVLYVEVFADDYAIAITIKRSVERGVTLIRRIEYHVERDQARSCAEQAVQQQSPQLP